MFISYFFLEIQNKVRKQSDIFRLPIQITEELINLNQN